MVNVVGLATSPVMATEPGGIVDVAAGMELVVWVETADDFEHAERTATSPTARAIRERTPRG
jgi:hypothetical protein